MLTLLETAAHQKVTLIKQYGCHALDCRNPDFFLIYILLPVGEIHLSVVSISRPSTSLPREVLCVYMCRIPPAHEPTRQLCSGRTAKAMMLSPWPPDTSDRGWRMGPHPSSKKPEEQRETGSSALGVRRRFNLAGENTKGSLCVAPHKFSDGFPDSITSVLAQTGGEAAQASRTGRSFDSLCKST